jgi:hypothetical protein
MSVCKKSSPLNSSGTCGARQHISKTISEIQPCRMAAAPAKVAIGIARDPGIEFGNRFDDEPSLSDENVETAAGHRITGRR